MADVTTPDKVKAWLRLADDTDDDLVGAATDAANAYVSRLDHLSDKARRRRRTRCRRDDARRATVPPA